MAGHLGGRGQTVNPADLRVVLVGPSGVLKVQLRKDGTWVGGKFDSTRMDSGGIPAPDAARNGAKTISNLSASDFPDTGVKIDSSGKILPPRR